MDNRSDDLIIQCLRFARERSIAGMPFGVEDLKEHLKAKGIDNPSPYVSIIWEEMHQKAWNTNHIRSWMSLDAYTALLDYEDLQQARQDAKDAKQSAKLAMWLNIISLVLTSVIGIVQICKS